MATDFRPNHSIASDACNTLAFEVPQPELMVCSVGKPCTTERDSSCSSQSITANISFNTIVSQRAKLRLDHAAVEGGRVFTSDPIAGKQSVMSPGT